MRKPATVAALTELGRVRLSKSFFMRDMLHSEIAQIHGLSNIPDDPDLAIEVGTRLCEDLLEPLQDRWGRVAVRSAYRSREVNALGNAKCHRWRCLQCFMDAAQVVVRDVQSDRRKMVFQPLGKAVGQPRKAAVVHPKREVLPLDIGCDFGAGRR